MAGNIAAIRKGFTLTGFPQKIFKYIRTFGVLAGCRLFFKIRRSTETGIIKFRIPGLKHPVFLRRDSSDYGVFEEVFIENEYKIPVTESPSYIIDAGANIGLTALYFLRQYPNANIVCIEPEETNYEMLSKNTADYNSVVCLKKALWSRLTHLQIKNLRTENWAFEVTETDDESNSVSAVTINEIVLHYNFPRIDILKVDIEGSEKEVFEANTEWAGKVKNVIVEIHENMREGALNSVIGLMTASNFNMTSTESLYVFYK